MSPRWLHAIDRGWGNATDEALSEDSVSCDPAGLCPGPGAECPGDPFGGECRRNRDIPDEDFPFRDGLLIMRRTYTALVALPLTAVLCGAADKPQWISAWSAADIVRSFKEDYMGHAFPA
jgi:hypothetical protein